jgi:sugar-phosphatase
VRFASAWVPVVVVTSAWRAEVAPVLDAADVARLLAGAVCADDVARHKPAPDAYLAALELTGVEPERAVAIEDSEAGIAAARAAGIRCAALPTTMPVERLRAADLLLDGLTPASVASLLLA